MTPRPAGDRGASLTGTAAAVVVFWLLLLATVQVLYGLHATTMVTSAAHDAAAEVAGLDAADDRCAAVPRAEATFRDRLGGYADRARVELTWSCVDPDAVRLRVRATHPSMLPPRLAGLSPLAEFDRTIVVRIEAPR